MPRRHDIGDSEEGLSGYLAREVTCELLDSNGANNESRHLIAALTPSVCWSLRKCLNSDSELCMIKQASSP